MVDPEAVFLMQGWFFRNDPGEHVVRNTPIM